MQIPFQRAAMAQNGSHTRKGKATVSAKMLTLVTNRRLSLDLASIKGYISENIVALILIYHLSGINVERAWDLIFVKSFLDPVTTRHLSQLQLLWRHRNSSCSPVQEWWAGFRSYNR